MKKIFAVILLCSTLFACCACGNTSADALSTNSELTDRLTANSHTPSDAEIGFLSYKWYETFPSVVEIMNTAGIKDYTAGTIKEFEVPDIFERGEDLAYKDLSDYYNTTMEYVIPSIVIPNRVVAGYQSEVQMNFLYPVIDNEIIEDEKYAELVEAVYYIDGIDDYDAAGGGKVYKDLYQKLAQVYGETELTNVEGKTVKDPFMTAIDRNIFQLHGAQAFWKANDGSSLLLRITPKYSPYDRFHYPYEWYTIEIHYYAPDYYESVLQYKDIETAKKAKEAEKKAAEEEAFRNNTNGL